MLFLLICILAFSQDLAYLLSDYFCLVGLVIWATGLFLLFLLFLPLLVLLNLKFLLFKILGYYPLLLFFVIDIHDPYACVLYRSHKSFRLYLAFLLSLVLQPHLLLLLFFLNLLLGQSLLFLPFELYPALTPCYVTTYYTLWKSMILFQNWSIIQKLQFPQPSNQPLPIIFESPWHWRWLEIKTGNALIANDFLEHFLRAFHLILR